MSAPPRHAASSGRNTLRWMGGQCRRGRGRQRKDAGMARLRSAPKPSLELVGGPGVVLGHIAVQQGPCKLVGLAEREEPCQFGLTSLGNSLPCSLLCEVDSLSFLKMDIKMHAGRGPLVHWEREQPPDCLVRAYVPAVQVVRDLVQTIVVVVQGEHGLVAPLVDILEYVLDGLDRDAEFHVDVGIKDPGEERIVRNDPLVVHFHLPVSLSDLDCVAFLSRRLSPVQRVLVLASLRLFQKLPRELLGALAVLHAGVVGVEAAAGAVEHALGDDGVQSWVSLDVGNLGRDEGVNLVTGNPVCKPDQEMKVGQAALLPLDAV